MVSNTWYAISLSLLYYYSTFDLCSFLSKSDEKTIKKVDGQNATAIDEMCQSGWPWESTVDYKLR